MKKSEHSFLFQSKLQQKLQTRWSDNDMYGHINNAIYYYFFDTTVNKLLIRNHLLSPDLTPSKSKPLIGFAISTGCTYLKPVSFPETLVIGLTVDKIGRSSVKYDLAVFREGEKNVSSYGWFTHVYVDKESKIPQEIPEKMRDFLKQFQHDLIN